MGMTIEEAIIIGIARKEHYELYGNSQEVAEAIEILIDTAKRYQMMQVDYETRLKADMVAMLTEIQLEIEELQGKYSPYYDEASQHTSEIIQQKIDKLRGEESG